MASCLIFELKLGLRLRLWLRPCPRFMLMVRSSCRPRLPKLVARLKHRLTLQIEFTPSHSVKLGSRPRPRIKTMAKARARARAEAYA